MNNGGFGEDTGGAYRSTLF